jgi:hypothetical protein
MSRKTILQLACVAASFASLIWLLSRIGWTTIATALSGVSLIVAAILMLLGVAEGLLDSLALRVITGPALRVGDALAVNSAGSLLNLVLPWESGEVLKGSLLHGKFGASRAASSTIIWNYIFKISRPAVALTSALLAVALYRGTAPTITMVLIVVGNLLGFAPYFVLRFAIRYAGAEKIVKLVRRFPLVRDRTAHWVEVAQSIDREVRGFWRERPRAFVEVLLLQGLARLIGWLNQYLGFRAVGLPYGFAETMLICATMNVAEYLIAFLPARIGVSEGTAFVVFRYYGLNGPLGLVLFTFLRFRNILVHGLIAPFAFIRRKQIAKAEIVVVVTPP